MEMLKTDVATFFPTACICGSQTGPFVDTGAEIYGAYHVYLCERCVTSAAEQLGFTRPSERARLDELVEAQRAFIEELEAEVEEEQADKFVSFEVARELLAVGPPIVTGEVSYTSKTPGVSSTATKERPRKPKDAA